MWTDGRGDAVLQGPLALYPQPLSRPARDLAAQAGRVHTAHAPAGVSRYARFPERRKLRAAPEDHLYDGIRASPTFVEFG